VDFVGLAKSLGMPAERISEPDALAPALQRALASPGPKLLDVIVDPRF
jgi:pyruvate dehydrogenase (quinone)